MIKQERKSFINLENRNVIKKLNISAEVPEGLKGPLTEALWGILVKTKLSLERMTGRQEDRQ